MILENNQSAFRYSGSFMNLKHVIDLETEDDGEFDPKLLKKFQELKKRYHSFLKGIPLLVVEKYYMENAQNRNRFVYLDYEKCELSDMRVINLYEELEGFYQEIFGLACRIASYYNLEIKLNYSSNSNQSSGL